MTQCIPFLFAQSSHNVNLTSEQEAHLMFRKLKDALDDKMIQYKEKGFAIQLSNRHSEIKMLSHNLRNCLHFQV